MLLLFFRCAGCNAENDIPAPEASHQLTRDEILRRCKCRRCGHVGASDMRRYWHQSANALDGSAEVGAARYFLQEPKIISRGK